MTDPQFEFIRNYCKLNKEIYLTFPKRSVKFKWDEFKFITCKDLNTLLNTWV